VGDAALSQRFNWPEVQALIAALVIPSAMEDAERVRAERGVTMKYLRGQNVIEDLVCEIPEGVVISELLPSFDHGYVLAYRRKGRSWTITWAGSVQSAMKTYRKVKRLCRSFEGIMGRWDEYSDGIVYKAEKDDYPHPHTEWYAVGVIRDDEEGKVVT